MFKVCILTSVHQTFDTRIFHKEAKVLAGAGYEVVLIVPHNQDEVVDGIQIRALLKPRGRRERMMRTIWQLYQVAIAENAKIYHFHDPELIPVGFLLKLRGKRVIYDAHEDVPRQILSKYWISRGLRGFVAKAAGLIEALAVRYLDGVVAATPVIAKRFPLGKRVLVQNFPLAGELVSPKRMPYAGRSPLFAYVGAVSEIRGINEMVQAVALIPDKLNARLILAGRFYPSQLESEIQSTHGWCRAEFLGWLSRVQLADLLGRVRAGLVVLHPTLNYLDSYPVKLFEYMSAGLPVVVSDFPLWRRIIEDAGCGILVDPLNPRLIAEAMRWLLEHPVEAEAMGRRGQQAIGERYKWDTEALKLLNFYKVLCNRE